MKKLIIILFGLFLISGIATLSFAQSTQTTSAKKTEAITETVRGKIVSVDAVKNTIVVKESKTGIEKTIAVDAKAISNLKDNELVKVTLKEGSDTAVSVKEIVKKTASVKK